MHYVDIVVCLLFFFGLFYFGLRPKRRVVTESSYLLADRNISLFALTATLVMTELNTATLISFSSMGYLAGTFALSLPSIFLFGLLFYAFTVAKKWKGFNGISVASYFSVRYGRDVGVLASIALLIAMAGFSAAYIKSLYLLFAPVFPQLSQWTLSAIMCALVLVMTLRGGLFSIIRTDVFSFLVVCLFFPLLAYFAYRTPISDQVDLATISLSPRFVTSLIVLTMFTYILAPWYGQKIFAARNQKIAFRAVLISALLVFTLYGLAVLTTWLFRKNGATLASHEQALPFAISMVLPKGLRGLGYGLLFAISATTLSGVWSAMCTLIVGDFFPEKEALGRKRSVMLSLCFALISFLLANLLVDRVFDKLILANIPVAALSFALLGGFYWKKTTKLGVYVSMFVGWGAGIGSYLYFGMAGVYTWYWAMLGIPATFIIGILVSILFPNKSILR